MANKFDESRYHLFEAYIESGSTAQLTKEDIEYFGFTND